MHFLQTHIFTQLEEESDPLVLAEAHFIAGLCHSEIDTDSSAFCMHLEEAISMSETKDRIHSAKAYSNYSFNTYGF